MALDFPSNPTSGQEYNGYIWNATDEVWERNPLPPVINATDINDIDTTGAEDGNALVYDATAGQWVPGVAAPSGVKENTSDNINIDFADNIPLETRAVTGDVTFTASNYTAGAHKKVYLTGDTVSRNLTFPVGWNFITDKPTAIGASKKNILDLNSFGTSESTTVGIWLGASSFTPITASGGTETEVLVSGVTYKIHTFLSGSNFIVAEIGDASELQLLTVAGGGGGGGGGGGAQGGGGGAGGFVEVANYALSSTGSFPVVVGLGGNGGAGSGGAGSDGGDSSVFSFVASGGGGGGGGGNPARVGGSGGGADRDGVVSGAASDQITSFATYTNVGFGNAGGNSTSSGASGAGGGGGANAPGGNGVEDSTSSGYGGIGGAGKPSSILGVEYYFAGGGGGTSWEGDPGDGGIGGGGGGSASTQSSVGGGLALATGGNSGPGQAGGNGGTNTGGGGGGGYGTTGGSGGSGIVVIRYPITDPN